MSTKLFRRTLATAALLVSALSVQADVVYSFDATAVGAFGTGPFGTVTLHDNGTGINVSVNLRGDMDFVTTGGPHTIFAFNTAGVVAADISNILFAGVAPGAGFTVILNADATPYGTFSLGIDCTGDNTLCPQGQNGATPDPLTFTVADAEYGDFGIENDKGASFAADVVCRDSSTIVACRGQTGSIAVTGPGGVPSSGGTPGNGGTPGAGTAPEPGSSALVLLALGILGLGFRARAKARQV